MREPLFSEPWYYWILKVNIWIDINLNEHRNCSDLLSPPNKKEKELSYSLIREDESIEFVTKLKVMEYAQRCGICWKPWNKFSPQKLPHIWKWK